MANSTAFKQEIARLDINVVRQGKGQLPISQVPRLEKNDILKIRLLDEAVNGIKPDQSNWEWTLLVAYVNPGLNGEMDKSISEEIQFKRTGWYKEYSFVVPYDNQPIFFLYPKPNYREKILNLINKNKDEIRKIGEKTIEIANAYAKVGSFLNELQFVLNRSTYGYYGYTNSYNTNVYGATDQYNTYDPYYSGGVTKISTFNKSLFMEQSIERLARSFNIQMPSCWQNGNYYGGSNNYSSPYNNNLYNNYGSGYSSNLMGNDLISRAQCLARSVRIEDLDFSIGKMLQQGGILAAQQLSQKYPQIAYWINIAAVAIDFILKLTQKTPLKLVPTVITTSLGQNTIATTQTVPYSNSFASGAETYQLNASTGQSPEQSRISLFAETSPMSDGFVTAYPIVIHKWQANADPEVIKLPIPVLTDSCLHVGANTLSSTDVLNDWMSDSFTKDFQLVINSSNGFRKSFALKKNVGLNGWEFFLTKEDLEDFPKINMQLNSVVVGKRGFNEISSPVFRLPSPTGNWSVASKSQDSFIVGGKRTITIQNGLNNCRCLQAVIYKPSFGGEYIFEANNPESGLRFSDDSKEVSFDIDTTAFQSDEGHLELKQVGGEITFLDIKLHPSLPTISEFNVSKGDQSFVIKGERIDQISALIINGDRAVVAQSKPNQSATPDEKTFVFENPKTRILLTNVTLGLELQDKRIYQYPQKFSVSLARPTIVANETKEVKALVIKNSQGSNKNAVPEKTAAPLSGAAKLNSSNEPEKSPDLSEGSSKITINLKNALTDYDFMAENISIETRIADFPNQSFEVELPNANFQVLDWKLIQVSFLITKPFMDILGKGKLQFRIRDKERGDSDWYTVRNSNGNEDPSLIHFSKKAGEVSKIETQIPGNQPLPNNLASIVNVNNVVDAGQNVVYKNLNFVENSSEKQADLSPNQTIAQTYTATALEFYLKKDFQNAYEYFNKAVIAEPNNPLYHYNLGSVLTALGDFPKAEKEMLQATKLEPENQTYKIGLDAAQQNTKRHCFSNICYNFE